MNLTPSNTGSSGFDATQLFQRIVSKWYYILICILVFLGLAFFYNKYSQPKYNIVATLQVKKQNNNNFSDPIALILNQKSANALNLPDEAVLLKSIPLLTSTINNLDVAVSYYYSNPLNNIELYKNSPFKLQISANSHDIPYEKVWKLIPINDKKYYLIDSNDKRYKFNFNEEVEISKFIFSITVENKENIKNYDFITFKVNNPLRMVMDYQSKINVIPFENSSIINLSVVGENPEKEIEFLTSLMNNIIEQDINRKRHKSEQTAKFIDQQLTENTDSLDIIESQIQQFKSQKISVDLSVEGNQLNANIKELEKQKANILLNDRYYNYLITSLKKQGDLDEGVFPSSLDPSLSKIINQVVELQLEVKLLTKDKRSKNPLVQEQLSRISELKENIMANVLNLKETNNIRLRDINNRIAMFSASLQRIPQAERELLNLKRDYRINENLYLLFMGKRMEAGISAATISSDYHIINQPINRGVVSASPFRNYSVAFLLGLILPIGFMLLLDFLGDKIKTKEELKAILSAPVSGSIVHNNDSKEALSSPSVLESFRSLRANLSYLAHPNQVLMFTSSMSGEGKTFCSYHLAQVLALTGKNVIWIDADLRRQQEAIPEQQGLSEYLAEFASLDNIILKTGTEHMQIIKAGYTPPNPSELLLSPRMVKLIEVLKEHFDCIIIDTPPLVAFSDALELMRLVDHTMLVVRHNYTKQTALKSTREFISNKNTQLLSIIYNDVKDKTSEYASKYYSNNKIHQHKRFQV